MWIQSTNTGSSENTDLDSEAEQLYITPNLYI